MLDDFMFGLKLILLVIGLYQFSKLKLGGLLLLVIPLFMTGVELISSSDHPWSYLLSSVATQQDYEKAVWGGLLFLMLPVLMYAICVREKISHESKNQKLGD